MSEMQNLTKRYIDFFWPECPDEVHVLIETRVIPAARRNPSGFATDRILKEVAESHWYEAADTKARHRFHKLVGHAVRVARDYEVETDSSGNPRHKNSKCGPHRRFTVQRPPRRRKS